MEKNILGNKGGGKQNVLSVCDENALLTPPSFPLIESRQAGTK